MDNKYRIWLRGSKAGMVIDMIKEGEVKEQQDMEITISSL